MFMLVSVVVYDIQRVNVLLGSNVGFGHGHLCVHVCLVSDITQVCYYRYVFKLGIRRYCVHRVSPGG